MGNKRHKAPVNPGLTNTVWIDRRYITDMAFSFGDSALQMSVGWCDPQDPKTNAIYTNAVLAMELYFKSVLVERITDPAFIKLDGDQKLSLATDDEIENESWNIANMHSRLVVPQEHRTHDIHKLFLALPEEDKETILIFVQGESKQISDMASLLAFIEKIKNYFTTKRYAFEYYLESVPSDSNYIYTVIPILKGINKAFGYVKS